MEGDVTDGNAFMLTAFIFVLQVPQQLPLAKDSAIVVQDWVDVYAHICSIMVKDQAGGPDKHASEAMDLEV